MAATSNQQPGQQPGASDQRHLTSDQRDQLRQIADSCDLRELLRCIGGIVSHDVADYSQALESSALIMRAANVIK